MKTLQQIFQYFLFTDESDVIPMGHINREVDDMDFTPF